MLCIFVNSRACLVLLVNIFPQQISPLSASSVDLAIIAEFLPRKTDTEDIIDAKRRKITVPWQECDLGWMVGLLDGLEELVAEAIKKQQRLDKLETEHVKQQAILTKS